MTGFRNVPSPRSGTHGAVGVRWAPIAAVTASARNTRFPAPGRLVVIPTADYRAACANSRPQKCGRPLAYVPSFPRQLAVGLVPGWTAVLSRGMYADASLVGTSVVCARGPVAGVCGLDYALRRHGRVDPCRRRHQRFHRPDLLGTDRWLLRIASQRHHYAARNRLDRLLRRRGGFRQPVQTWQYAALRPFAGSAHFAEYRLALGHVLWSAPCACPVGVSLRHQQPGHPVVRRQQSRQLRPRSERAELLCILQSVQRRAWRRRADLRSATELARRHGRWDQRRRAR